MRVIGIGGVPGSGKSSVVKRILKTLGDGHDFQFQLLKGIKYIHNKPRLIILGKYEEDVLFCGTDRLSMIAIVSIKAFITMCLETNKFQDYVILFEGDRFFKSAVFNFLEENSIDYSLYILNVNSELLDERRANRGEKNHTDKFLKGRKTMYENIISQYPSRVTQLPNNNSTELDTIIETIFSDLSSQK